MSDANSIDTYEHSPAAVWQPAFPPGRIERIYIHWSAHPYDEVFPAYHFCVAMRDSEIVVAHTHDLRENMRDVSADPEKPYAQHTRGRNGFAAGISVMGMQDATPGDFGPFPLTEPLIDALCMVGARLAAFYEVPVDPDHVLTHAEAAVADGYFGNGENQRWDIARLHPEGRPLSPGDAAYAGNQLRRRIAEHCKKLPGRA